MLRLVLTRGTRSAKSNNPAGASDTKLARFTRSASRAPFSSTEIPRHLRQILAMRAHIAIGLPWLRLKLPGGTQRARCRARNGISRILPSGASLARGGTRSCAKVAIDTCSALGSARAGKAPRRARRGAAPRRRPGFAVAPCLAATRARCVRLARAPVSASRALTTACAGSLARLAPVSRGASPTRRCVWCACWRVPSGIAQ